ncbi:MAG: S-methyl-5'-thioadenosine phosphorylase [Acidimicrobiales bacterium]
MTDPGGSGGPLPDRLLPDRPLPDRPLPDRPAEPLADYAVIGGSGFYELLADADELAIDTPFGAPAGPVTIGTLAGRRVAFLPRHGREHQFAAHRVPFRANVWALASLGVRGILAPCSTGSLQPDLHPGDFVVVDQLVDRTWGRPDTFFDVGGPEGEPGRTHPVHHQSFAEPYDASLRAALVAAARDRGVTVHDGGTMVVINGPRFSTRAESVWFRSMGWHVVNMTGYPEAVLAAEAGVPYATVALVTDDDAGVDGHAPVTLDEVFAVMRRNVATVRDVLAGAIAALP